MEEIKINSINDIYAIEENKKFYYHISERDPYDDIKLFYRGQVNYNWKLEPSIKRNKIHTEFEELKGYNYDSDDLFAYIAKCQHYGKRTRFLDYSTNIDVALFFACYDIENKYNNIDSSIFICPYRPRKIAWCDTMIISELTLLKTEITVKEFANYLFREYDEIKRRYVGDTNEFAVNIVSWLNHGFMVLPDDKEYDKIGKENSRIVAQHGAFFICGNKTKEPLDYRHRISSYAANNIILPEIEDVPSTINDRNSVIKIRIPASLKKEILVYLDLKGVNNNTLLCD